MQLCYIDFLMMGDRLKDILSREGTTAARICQETGIDKGMMSRFLSGKINLSLKKMILIADHLGYDVDFVKRKPARKGR